MSISIKDRALVEAVTDVIEPPKAKTLKPGQERLAAMQARHLARSKASRIIMLVRQEDTQ